MTLDEIREALRHPRPATMAVVPPASVVAVWYDAAQALVALVDEVRDVHANVADPTTGWYQPDVAAALRDALAPVAEDA